MIATGKVDESLLTKYGNNDFVVDDDMVKKANPILLFEETYFNCIFSNYEYLSELRCGYYKGNCGDILNFNSKNNWILDTFYIDINNPKSILVIHRGFNLQNYVKETLRLKINIIINSNDTPISMLFEFTNSYGSSGFQGWLPKDKNFFQTYVDNYLKIFWIKVEYYGALN